MAMLDVAPAFKEDDQQISSDRWRRLNAEGEHGWRASTAKPSSETRADPMRMLQIISVCVLALPNITM